MAAFLTDKHLMDLVSSGLSEDTINSSGVYSADAAETRLILDRRDIECGSLVFPYPNTGDPPFKRVKPDGIVLNREGKPAKYLQKSQTESRLYISNAVLKDLQDTKDAGLPLLITEGEKKVLKATEELYTNEKLCIPIGLAGVWNWRRETEIFDTKTNKTKRVPDFISDIKKLPVKDRIIYICFDSDIVINDQVADAELALSYYLKGRGTFAVKAIRIPNEDYKLGLDDFIVKYGRNEFKKLIESAGSDHLVKYQIKMLRKVPDLSPKDKLDQISDLIIKDHKSYGKFYHNDNGSYFYSKKDHRVYQIEEEVYSMKLADNYGLYRGDNEFAGVHGKIEEEAIFHGTNINIFNFAYFDNNLYAYNNNGGLYVIERDRIHYEFNGFRDVLFTHRLNNEEIKYIPNCHDYFQQYILNVANFQANDNTRLSPEHQRLLFTTWFYSLFFPNMLPTKPILVMTGDYGSGKSTIQRLVGKLLFGDNFDVTTLQSEKDFLTSIVNVYYLVYDNVDVNQEWVRNAIASLATGFRVKIRKLYSNLEMFEAKPICYLALNSMTQSIYNRPDVANRLLIFRTKRIDNYIPELKLQRDVKEHRNEILSEIFDNLKNIIPYINNEIEYHGSFRLADFANLGIKINKAFGSEKEFENCLSILTDEQRLLPLENNVIVDLLEKYIASHPFKEYISTAELYHQLRAVSDEMRLPFPFKSVRSFGHALANSKDNLRLLFTISTKAGRSNTTEWWFELK